MESSSSSSTTHPVTPNSSITNSNSNSNSTRSVCKKTADTDLKSSIIEFMRHRPFLWNARHPDYKDHKRREHEFRLFSNEIDCSVQEIKRVWHVLRTNFFRAHKLLMERPHNGENGGGERLWKYYLAMDFILEGTGASPTSSSTAAADTDSSSKDIKRETRSSKLVRVGGSGGGESKVNSRLYQRDVSNYNDSNDDDHLYARSLTATLRRFDPTTREIIKLKFQEIIVSYTSNLR